ncbi:MAG: hypothetical protein GTO24_14085 [candidate division Zixibacteria bacterium]|nr:hypothetical protein [candidate division Zixibacteria bacterium]
MDRDRKHTISIIIVILLLALLMRVLLVYLSNYTADDSFITFRYAENIASGKGFVYNEGERILGTSTPLYTLLLALLVKLGLPIIWVARVINIGADCLTALLLFLLFRPFKLGVATFAALFYVIFPRVMVWSVSGMETSLYVLFIASSLYSYYKENFHLTSLFLALTFLTRVDGIIVGLAIFIHFLFRYRRFPTRMVLIALALIIPWLVFSTAYFGSPIPNSVPGKKALYAGSMWETPKWKIFWEFLFLKTKVGLPLLVLATAGIYRILSKARSYSVVVLWTSLYLVFFFFAQTKIHMWYYVPFYLGYLSLVSFGLHFVFDKANHVWKRWLQLSRNRTKIFYSIKTLGVALFPIIVISAGLIYFQQIRRTYKFVTAEQVGLEGIHKNMGLWLRENIEPGDTVCAEDIGYLGYYSGRYILDQDGLISPQAIPFNQEMNRLGLLKRYKPAYFLIGFAGPYYSQLTQSDWLEQNYEKQATFGVNTLKPERAKISLKNLDWHVCKYNIYKRVNSTN